MGTPFVCFISGEEADVVETATALHAKGIKPVFIPVGDVALTLLPPFCPIADPSHTPDLILELTIPNSHAKRERLRACLAMSGLDTPLLSCSVAVSAAEQATWITPTSNLAGFSFLPGQFSRELIELAPTNATSGEIITAVEDFTIRLGKQLSVVQDRIGMVLPRVICSLVNEAFFAITEGAATPNDIDTAMKLGTNYPMGPMEWGNAIGLANVVTILDSLYGDTGEDRYRVAPLLRQMALTPTF